MLAKEFIKKSKSLIGAPIFFVLIKKGELRLVEDDRRLNEITFPNSFPLPLIICMLEKLLKGKIFLKIDLHDAFNLIRIKRGHEYKIVFPCVFGHFEYLVMSFGLKNAPSVFQHFINVSNIKQLQLFLGLVNYYLQFIIPFTKISHNLNFLLRKTFLMN